ncbi:MAG: sigma 54-interacting transcriptional regulator [Firmicutes bacterium]|nr:sigma 54-interacting transcriptional regulator [Bacillota bacterium]
MNAKEYQAILRAAAEVLGGAMHIVNSEGITILYNEEMAQLEKQQIRNVIGKPFREVFSNIPEEESTLMRALKERKATKNQQQTYLNVYGKEINTVNSTVPIIVDGKIIAAMEVARDITDIKNMSDTILDLQSNLTASKTPEDAEESEEKKSRKRGIREYRFSDIIGENRKFEETIARAKKAAHNDTSVILYGETGVGKELFAQSIHYDGLRKKSPFLAQNCAAIPETLLEGMLFGTAKGGFTGAVDRAGLFEQANGGTLLLDEVSAMPIGLQGKLLRVLQEEYIRRVGGSKDIPIDVRIIATINEPAKDLIARGALRQDLYYRLGTLSITIPPLRERKDDILLLCNAFLKKYNERFGKEIWMLSDGAETKLMKYNYPGNVRELENIIMAAVSMADDGQHVLTDKDVEIGGGYSEAADASGSHAAESFVETGGSLAEYLSGIEETVIRQYLTANDNNVSKTAKDLGMLRQNLQHKIKKYGI